jgi:uncharacterized RDD family membrane protein YckC
MIRVGFGKRFAAWLIDHMLIGVVAAVLFFAVGERNLSFFAALDGNGTEQLLSGDEQADEDDEAAALSEALEEQLGVSLNALSIVSGINILLFTLYSLLEVLMGATLGKRWLGIMIASSDGVAATGRTLALRWLWKNGSYCATMVASVWAVLGTLGGLWSLLMMIGCLGVLGSSKQAFHDVLTATAVFHRVDVVGIENNPA